MKVGCFGKLPVYADFIKINGASSCFQVMDRWFQEGIHLGHQVIGSDWESEYMKSPPYRFLFQNEVTPGALTGVFIPGQDKTGRKFPYTIFSESSVVPLKSLNDYLGMAEGQLFRKVEAFNKQDLTGLDLASFTTSFRTWAAQVQANESRPVEDWQAKSNRLFWEELFGSLADKKKYLLVQNLFDTVKSLKRMTSLVKFPGFKIPVSYSSLTATMQVRFWVSLLLKILEKDHLPLSVFWSESTPAASPDAAFVYIFIGKPTSKGFLSLITPNYQGDNTYPSDLSTIRMSKCDDLIRAMNQDLKQALDAPDIPLSELCVRLAGISSPNPR